MAKQLSDCVSNDAPAQNHAGANLSFAQGRGRQALHLALVSDDSALDAAVRNAMRNGTHDWVVDTCANTRQALKRISPPLPAVALIDISKPGGLGLKGVPCFRMAFPAVPVVVLSTSKDRQSILLALLADACGYLVKPATTAEIAQTVLAAHAGLGALCEQAKYMLESCIHGKAAAGSAGSDPHQLTLEERKFMACLAKHYSTKDIADMLGLAYRSVDAVRSQVYRKLGVHTSADALRKYKELQGSHPNTSDKRNSLSTRTPAYVSEKVDGLPAV